MSRSDAGFDPDDLANPRCIYCGETFNPDEEPSDAPLVDVSKRTLRRWMEAATETLHERTGDPGWQFVGFHDLRRTWATQLRSADVDAMVVLDWGGWSDLDTFLAVVQALSPHP